jgi:hypothetical protein
MQRITGPYSGYFIAASSARSGTSWKGIARIFAFRPKAFNDEAASVNLSGDSHYCPSALDAVQNAERVARERIVGLKPRPAL